MLRRLLSFLWILQTSAGTALVQRKRMRQGWTLWFEIMARTLKRDSAAVIDLPIEEHRRWYELLAGPVRPHPLVRRDETIAGVPCVWVEHRDAPADRPVLVYLHGGAMQVGSFRTHGRMVVTLAKQTGLDAVFPEYRLAPEHRWPAGHDDVWAVVRALAERGRSLVLAGDSAGGLLSVGMCLRAREHGVAMPIGIALLCPWVDLAEEQPSRHRNAPFDWDEPEHYVSWAEVYANGADRNLPELSPVRADLHGLPPTLVQYGTAELIADEAHLFCERARAHGVSVVESPYADMIHNWHLMDGWGIPEPKRAIDEIVAFMRERAAAPRPRDTADRARA
jgi:monoterpene epsilon-lactone hydrolase